MKKPLYLLLLCVVIVSCSKSTNYGLPIVNNNKLNWELSGSFDNSVPWPIYERDYIFWSTNFTSLGTAQNEITKREFLTQLTTGKFVPIKINTKDSSLCYQLFKLEKSKTKNKEVSNVIKNKAITELQHFGMEGKPLPKFNFTDLNERVYNAESTKGKIVVVKCWFIGCSPCVKEMPMLNRLVKKFEHQDDILFVSLAYDSAEDLKKFFTKKIFDYKVVPVADSYFYDDLKINAFPTHIIIGRDGLIKSVTNDGTELVAHLSIDKNGVSEIIANSEKMLIRKRILNMGSMPPPPPPLVK